MNLLESRIGFALALVSGMLVCGIATATPITMDFDGLTPGTSVDNYYNNGCSHASIFGIPTSKPVDCNGPDDGVAWKNAAVKNLGDAQSQPNYAGVGLLSGLLGNSTITMDVADGFDTGLTFYYTTFAKFLSGTVTIYDGIDGSGSVLTSMNLSGTGIYCNGDLPCWLQTGLDFTGTAKSVIFDGSGSVSGLLFGLDDVTVGANLTATPVPEPAALGIFGLGLLLIGAFVGLRPRTSQS